MVSVLAVSVVSVSIYQHEWYHIINDIFLTGIVFEAHTPLGRPGLAAESNDPIVLDDPVIKEIAVKHNASAAQVSCTPVFSLGLFQRALCPLGPLMCPLGLPKNQ